MDSNDFTENIQNLRRNADGQVADTDSETPPLEPVSPTPVPALSPLASTSILDVEMADIRNEDDMPDLQSISDSDSESDRDAFEVEMHTVTNEDFSDDPPLPDLEAVNPLPRPNNRRARVEDDEDDERDRRHPSERVGPSPNNETSASSSSNSNPSSNLPLPSPNVPHHNFVFPLNLGISSSSPISTPAVPRPPPNRPPSQPTPTPQASEPIPTPNRSEGNRHHIPQFMTGGIAISIDLGGHPFPPGGNAEGGPTDDNTTHGGDSQGMPQGFGGLDGPEAFADFISNPAFLNDLFGIEPDVDDPERADKLINGLEQVSVGLVRRLERVGGMAGTSRGSELNGGDSGCAICWENLLEAEVEVAREAADSSSPPPEGQRPRGYPKVVTLPCAHAFHAACLRPWFSRPKQTTCPTCRFNIDPENLTYIPPRQRRRRAERPSTENATNNSTSATSPPPTTPDAPSEPTADPSPPTQQASEPSASTQPTHEEVRGRMTSPPLRRAGSEPPANRIPHRGMRPEAVQSFAIPGGHLVVVNHPIGIISNGGQPSGELYLQQSYLLPNLADAHRRHAGLHQQEPAQHQGQADSLATDPTNAPHPPQTTGSPVFGPPPPPSFPGGNGRRILPPFGGPGTPGVFAFDFHLPLPFVFPVTDQPQTPQVPRQPPQTTVDPQPSQPQQQQTQPEIRIPQTGFAGVNFGHTPATGQPVNVSDLLRRLFNGVPPPQAAQQQRQTPATPAPTAAPSADDAPAAASPGGGVPPPPENGHQEELPRPGSEDGMNFLRFFASSLNNPTVLLRLLMAAGLGGGGVPGSGRPATASGAQPAVKKDWTPPPAPGPTLRQRIEKREREAGLRCYDVSCGVGPSDEEPFVSLTDAALKQLSIHYKGDEKGAKGNVCSHTFHSSCLVSAERVALRGADASVVGEDVEVSCPVCRGVGCVSKSEWDEGVGNLQ